MMRWRLVRPDGRKLALARAVDTATLPSHQGRGIFTKLTMTAVEHLTASGTDAIFNTPNDKSRPGYVKMGWEVCGRAPVRVRPRSIPALVAMARSRTSADKWGEPTSVGLAPAEAFEDRRAVEGAIGAMAPTDRWSTPLSVDYLRWRTAFEPLACRVEPIGSDLSRGLVVFRIRQRGSIRQLSILHAIAPGGERGVRPTIARLLRQTGCDVALSSGGSLGLASGMVPLPSTGPILTWRMLADRSGVPSMDQLSLDLGTIELF